MQSCELANEEKGYSPNQDLPTPSVTALGRIDTRTRLRNLSPLKTGILKTMEVSVGD